MVPKCLRNIPSKETRETSRESAEWTGDSCDVQKRAERSRRRSEEFKQRPANELSKDNKENERD